MRRSFIAAAFIVMLSTVGLGTTLMRLADTSSRTAQADETAPDTGDTPSATSSPSPQSSPSPPPTPARPAPTFTPTVQPRYLPDLSAPAKKQIAMQLVSSAENSTLNWQSAYSYIQDIHDGRGYTAGIIGFTSGTGDMLELVKRYTAKRPGNSLAPYIPALTQVNGSDSLEGLGAPYINAWKAAANDTLFRAAQDELRDQWYFNPAVAQAKKDGLDILGQFMYYDAIVMHGPGNDPTSFSGLRASAMARARTPIQGGAETTYLNAFLEVRRAAMKREDSHTDTSRIDTEQRRFLQAGNLSLSLPLVWQTYGDTYRLP